MTFKKFMEYCQPAANMATMMMTGIEAVAPEVWEIMPDRAYSFDELAFIVSHLCTDKPHLRYHLSIHGQLIEYTPVGGFAFREATREERNLSVSEFARIYNGVII